MRACVGPRFPVSLRISADDFLKGGNTLEDSLRILELCQDKVDIINVSAAQNDNLNLQIDQMSLEDGWKRYLSRACAINSISPRSSPAIFAHHRWPRIFSPAAMPTLLPLAAA